MAPKRKNSKKAIRKAQKKQKTLKDPRPAFFKRNDLEWSGPASEAVWDMAMAIHGVPPVENGEFFPDVCGKVKMVRFYYDTLGNVCGIFKIKTNRLAVVVGVAPDPAETIKEIWPHCTIQRVGERYIVSAPLVSEWGNVKTLQPYDLDIIWKKKKSAYKIVVAGSGSKKNTLAKFCKLPDEGMTLEYLQMIAGQRLRTVSVSLSPEHNHLVEQAGLIHASSHGTIARHKKIYLLPPSP